MLLVEGGWKPVSLVLGSRFVRAFRRKPTLTMHQKVQNVELGIPTEALTRPRSETMALIAERTRECQGQGLVELSLMSGPVPFATHVRFFVARALR